MLYEFGRSREPHVHKRAVLERAVSDQDRADHLGAIGRNLPQQGIRVPYQPAAGEVRTLRNYHGRALEIAALEHEAFKNSLFSGEF